MRAIDEFGGAPLIDGEMWDESKFSLQKVFTDYVKKFGLETLFSIDVSPDLKNTDRQLIYVSKK